MPLGCGTTTLRPAKLRLHTSPSQRNTFGSDMVSAGSVARRRCRSPEMRRATLCMPIDAASCSTASRCVIQAFETDTPQQVHPGFTDAVGGLQPSPYDAEAHWGVTLSVDDADSVAARTTKLPDSPLVVPHTLGRTICAPAQTSPGLAARDLRREELVDARTDLGCEALDALVVVWRGHDSDELGDTDPAVLGEALRHQLGSSVRLV